MSTDAYTLFYRRRAAFDPPMPAPVAAPTGPQRVSQRNFEDAVKDARELLRGYPSREELLAEAKKLLEVQLGNDQLDYSGVDEDEALEEL